MTTHADVRQELLTQIAHLPEERLQDVLLFVNFLLYRQNHLEPLPVDEKLEVRLLSEFSLAKDWLKPEGEEAWRDLGRVMLSFLSFF